MRLCLHWCHQSCSRYSRETGWRLLDRSKGGARGERGKRRGGERRPTYHVVHADTDQNEGQNARKRGEGNACHGRGTGGGGVVCMRGESVMRKRLKKCCATRKHPKRPDKTPPKSKQHQRNSQLNERGWGGCHKIVPDFRGGRDKQKPCRRHI